jgi:septal ring factor EnvC (AmiA/AmiB activator)
MSGRKSWLAWAFLLVFLLLFLPTLRADDPLTGVSTLELIEEAMTLINDQMTRLDEREMLLEQRETSLNEREISLRETEQSITRIETLLSDYNESLRNCEDEKRRLRQLLVVEGVVLGIVAAIFAIR